MTSFRSFRLPAFAAGLCALALAGAAVAGNSPGPSELPLCVQGADQDACRLPVKSDQFDTLDGWERRSGLPSIGYDESGNSYASLFTGAAIGQEVYAHFGRSSQDVAYVLRFRMRSDNAPAQVRAALSMTDAGGTRTVPLGSVVDTAHPGGWSVVELAVNGAPFAAPAHVSIEIASEGGNHDTVQVDDVYLIQSADAGVLRPR